MLKTAHVVPRIDAEASGVSYCVPRLCEALATVGQELELHALAPLPRGSGRGYATHAHREWRLLRRLGVSPEMRRALAAAAETADIMHSHSLWMMPNIYPAAAVKKTRCRLITSPHGCLSEYMAKRSRWAKRAVWALGQGEVLRNSACLHATAESEYRDIRRSGLGAPVAVIPNGIDIPLEGKRPDHASDTRRLLYLGRIHPQKGTDILLRAWARLQSKRPDWELWIVGPGNHAYCSRLRALAGELGLERVTFPGPVYGAEKSRTYRSADLFVLPSHSENFGLVVAEALAHGIPAVATRGAPWSGLEKQACGWSVAIGVGPLTDCLEEATSKPSAVLLEMGRSGRRWMKSAFSWNKIGRMMHQTYQWVLGGGPPLQWILLD